MIDLHIFGPLDIAILLVQMRDEADPGPVRIICPTCQRDVAPQVYHWHMESHRPWI
jgi:hypothetical protein